MTEQEQKIWDEAWEQGRKRGVEQGERAMRYTKFIQPLLRCILMGFMFALGTVFAIGALGFLLVGSYDNILISLLGFIIGGVISGSSFGVFAYLVGN